MATVPSRQSRRAVRPGRGRQLAPQSSPASKVRKAGTLRRAAIVVLLLIGTVWTLPWIAGRPAVLNRVANVALSGRGVRLTVRGVSLGWFSPLVLRDIELLDADGQPVLEAQEIRTSRSLVALLLSRSNLGRWTINRPLLHVRLMNDTTNLEQMLATAVADDTAADDDDANSDSGTRLPHGVLTIVDGSARIVDVDSTQAWTLSQLACEAVLSTAEIRFNGSGRVQDQGRPTQQGRFACQGNMRFARRDLPQKSANEPDPTNEQTKMPRRAEAHFAGTPGRDGQPSEPQPQQPHTTPPTVAANANRPVDWDGQIEIEASQLPLSLATAVGRRFSSDTHFGGRLSTTLLYRWASLPGQLPRSQIEANVAAEEFALAGPFLGDDRLQLAKLQLPCRLTREGDYVNIERLELRSELANVAYRGALRLGDDWKEALTSQTFELTGRVDVARLAAALPSTIRVRDDTRITAGQIQIALRRQRQGQAFAIQGSLDADRLAAERAGRPVVWQQPLRVTFAARETTRGIAIDDLRCEADFLDLQAAGSPQRLQINGQIDLDRLGQELGRFVDLEPLTFKGQGTLQLTLLREVDRFAIEGRADATGLVIQTDSPQPWNDPQITLRFEAQGQAQQWKWQTIESGSVGVEAGSDRLQVALRGPVAIGTETPAAWPLAIALQGELERWQSRVRPWLGTLDDWRLQGNVDCNASLQYDHQSLTVSQSRCRMRGLRVAGSAIDIDEPALELVLAGRVSTDARQLNLDQLSLASSTLLVQSNSLRVTLPDEGPPQAQGVLRYQGDVNRLLGWFETGDDPNTTRYWGTARGELRLLHQQGQAQAEADLIVEQFVAQWSPETIWREPQVRLLATLRYNDQADRLQIADCRLVSSSLNCTLSGTLDDLYGQRLLALDGQVQYDLDRLNGLIQSFAGSGVRLTGQGREAFSVRGPLASSSSPAASPSEKTMVTVQRDASSNADAAASAPLLARLEAEAGLGWQAADVYGFLVGPGLLRARLERGLLQIEPLDLVVSQGRLRAAPQVRLSPGPAMLWLPQGQLIEQVRITPAMCAAALQYIAPVLAGVAEAEGRFSVALSDCRVPIASPDASEVSGTLTVHDVRVGAGPLVRELALLLDEPGQIRLARQSNVQFRMVGGRIYHQGLELVFPDATIRTYGSVGLDQSLALMVEMPVPRKWIGNNPLGEALRRRIIRLPVGGTLSQPRIDRREMDRLAAQFIQEAAGDALREQINRGLNRLLGPPR